VKAILALVIPAFSALALGIALIVAFGLGGSFLPVNALVPRAPEPLTLIQGNGGSSAICGAGKSAPVSALGSGLVGVTPAPTTVTAEWQPGENSMQCRSETTRGGPALAASLATAINHDPVVQGGAYMCPLDDGASVTLYFSYPHSLVAEVVKVNLGGCEWISDPGRTSRWWSGPRTVDAGFLPALSSLTPRAWKQYLPESAGVSGVRK
jgi:hypothetical protein